MLVLGARAGSAAPASATPSVTPAVTNPSRTSINEETVVRGRSEALGTSTENPAFRLLAPAVPAWMNCEIAQVASLAAPPALPAGLLSGRMESRQTVSLISLSLFVVGVRRHSRPPTRPGSLKCTV